MHSDDELYGRFLDGETSAYDELMIRYGDQVTRFLYGFIKDWHDAEDLMIEAFARIMLKRPAMREGGFKSYLFKTARNMATRYHDKHKKRQAFSLEEMSEEITERVMTEDYICDKERRQVLEECLSKIQPRQKEALCLIYFEGMRYEEAARVMGVTKKRIDHLLSAGKEMLRKELEKEGVTDAY